MKIKITLTEEMLGTKAANPDVFADFIASKAPDGDRRKLELDNAEHREEAGTTVFHRMKLRDIITLSGSNGAAIAAKFSDRNMDDLISGIYDYQIKGFFKDACGALRNADGKLSKKITAYKSKIDGLVFVGPRFIPCVLFEGAKIGVCERPLRAETAQGPRVSVCRSETIPAGSTLEFEVTILAAKIGKGDDAVNAEELVREWFDYGQLRGLGQWRNSGKGRFTYDTITTKTIAK